MSLTSVWIVAAKTSLTSFEAGRLLIVMLAAWLLAGVLLWIVRRGVRGADEEPGSFLRGWLAVTLVLVLSVACVGAFQLDDAQLRNTLVGGLVASTGTAIAFYFSSKGAESARKDLLTTATALAQAGTAPTAFSSPEPAEGKKDQDYSHEFVANGTPPVKYALGSGALPDGLQLGSDGTLSGKPAASGEFPITVVASNALGSLSSPAYLLKVAE